MIVGSQFSGHELPTPGSNSAKAAGIWPVSPELIVWCLVGLAPVAVASFTGELWIGLLLVSAAGLAHSFRAFQASGGPLITASGLYCVSASLFLYFPGIYMCFNDPVAHGPMSTLTAVVVTYMSQLAMFHLMWQPHFPSVRPAPPDAPPSVTIWGMAVGCLLIGLGIVATFLSFAQPLLWNGASYTGIVILAAAVFERPQAVKAGYLVVIAAFALYGVYIFTGYGRLQLGTLGFALAMLLAARWPGRRAKIALIGILVPAVLYLARARVALVSDRYGENGENGLESILAPLVRFSELLYLDADGRLLHNFGSSFWAAAVVLVPRSLWPEKPTGLGAELLDLFAPQMRGTGHSEVAFYLGEWVLAFGIGGCLLAALLVGLAVRRLDTQVVRTLTTGVSDRLSLMRRVIVTLVCSGLPDYVWAGAATYASRVGTRLFFAGAIVLLCLLTAKAARSAGFPSGERSGGHQEPEPATVASGRRR